MTHDSASVSQVAPPQPPRPLAPERPRPRRRWLRVLLWIAVPLVVLVVLFFIADGLVRSYAEGRVKSELTQSLPADVRADVSVRIGGVSVIAQYLSGTFERIELDAPHVTYQSIPLAASVVLTGVPADTTKPISGLTGTIVISQSSVNSLLKLPGVSGDLQFGDGTVQYQGTASVLGFDVGYTVTVEPTANGDTILLKPTKAEVTAGGGNLDLSQFIGTVVGSKPLSICVAQYLPKGVEVEGVTVSRGSATIRLSAHDLALSESTLSTKGSCS